MRIVDQGSFTDAGGREANEDALLQIAGIPLFAVADGMGNEGAGAKAAEQVLAHVEGARQPLIELFDAVASDRTAASRVRVVETFDTLVNEAGRNVQRSAEELGSVGMATTLLMAALVGHTAYIGHVGDSRAYLLREGRILRLTEDHTVAEFRFRRGRMTREEYLESPERHVLYQAVGSGPEVDVDLAEVRLADGDILLLCTDGLIRALDEARVAEVLCESDDLSAALEGLRVEATADEPPDNLTAIALRFEAEAEDPAIREVTDAMAGCFLFANLTDPERLVVAPYVEEASWQRGDLVTSPEGPADHLGILISGRVRETGRVGDGRDLGPGDWFGAAALAGAGVWRSTRTALEPTRVLWFSRERFREVVRYKPDLGGRMAMALADELRDQLRHRELRLERVARALGMSRG